MTAFGGDQRTMRDSGPAGSAATISTSDTVKVQQGRALLIDCTALGTVKVGFPDGSTLTVHVPAAGIYEFNWAVNQVYATGTSATATYYNLY